MPSNNCLLGWWTFATIVELHDGEVNASTVEERRALPKKMLKRRYEGDMRFMMQVISRDA
jgi:hypothetical protein